jgi:ABC-type branched-subunit amino acid transport system substrate-binding protein
MKSLITRFAKRCQPSGNYPPVRYRAMTGLLALCVLLTGCIDKNYIPPPKAPSPDHYSAEVSSAPFDEDLAKMRQSAVTPLASTNQNITKVALLVPLTGRNRDLGRALQHAATLAIFDRYAGLSPKRLGAKLKLISIDTGDTEEQAKHAAQQAIAQKVKLVIGPVFADKVRVIAPIMRTANIPVISFSNNPAVAQSGIYIFGFSPEQQTKRMIEYAITGGRTRLAALVPDNAYGRTVLGAAQNMLRKYDLALVAQAHYSSAGIGIDAAIDSLIPPGVSPAFDALFLPESGAALETILHSLDARTPKRIGLFGTGLWDDYSLIRRVNLQGAILASSPPELTRAFEKRFSQTYHYAPPRIASLAYDAVALAVTLTTSGRGFDNKVLTHPAGFSGPANGLFRFKPSGISERKLAIIIVQGTSYLVVDRAPVSFAP